MCLRARLRMGCSRLEGGTESAAAEVDARSSGRATEESILSESRMM